MAEIRMDMRRKVDSGLSISSKKIIYRKSEKVSADFLVQSFQTELLARGRRSSRVLLRNSSQKQRACSANPLRSLDGAHALHEKQILQETHFSRRCFFLQKRLRGWLHRASAFSSLSPTFILRASMIGAIFFGVGSTMLVSHYLGEYASAKSEQRVIIENRIAKTNRNESVVLGAMTEDVSTADTSSESGEDVLADTVLNDFKDTEMEKREAFEEKLHTLLAGYPIDEMVPYIADQDRIIAAFLVGIAKKESAWGKRVPLYKEHDCFNYWGYRGRRRFMGTGGHTCFNSPEDAVKTVSKRLEKLVYTDRRDTPAEMMVVWKCGYDCSGHSQADTRKWISDVEMYFREVDEDG